MKIIIELMEIVKTRERLIWFFYIKKILFLAQKKYKNTLCVTFVIAKKWKIKINELCGNFHHHKFSGEFTSDHLTIATNFF